MLFNKAISIAILAFVGKTLADCPHAKKDGYPCCSSCQVIYEDDTGLWGVENDNWCGIDSSCMGVNCWAFALGYGCCSHSCEALDITSEGRWAVENDQWCGIIERNCQSPATTSTTTTTTTYTTIPYTTPTNPSNPGTGYDITTQTKPGWTPGNDQVLPGFLSTDGRYIVDEKGRRVKLAGLSWFGGETTDLAPHGLWAKPLGYLINVVKELGYNHIRYPWTNQMFSAGAKPHSVDKVQNPDLANLSPLEIMDAVIDACGKAGLKVYLDRHRPEGAGQSELWYTSKTSEDQWIKDWVFLAERYKGNPTVIGADLHNEPHGNACWGCGETNRDWRLAAERCGNAIHEVNPDWLIIVEGNDHYGEEGWQKGESYWWGGMLKGVRENPVRLKVKNKLVYSAHDYDKNVHLQDWFKEPDFPDNMPKVWDDKWGYIAKEDIAPVLIGEFGSRLGDEIDVKWLENLITYMNENGVHWTFWCLNPNSGDTEGILGYDWQTVNKQKDGILNPGKAPEFLI
jgi:aryl-phospho-beta-D-glucosidase BglC (GH1 family)